MRYYKIIIDNKFIGVGTTIDLRKFQKKNKIFLSCCEDEAQYIQCDGKLYRSTWMLPDEIHKKTIPLAGVIEIMQSEYEAIYKALESNKEITLDEEVYEEPEDDNINEEDRITIDYVKESKIKEMKSVCNKMITDGFDVKLSDGESHHFSLTVHDQLNLITSYQTMLDGVEMIPYHADGELCKYYSVTDMNQIVEMANSFKTYHVAYFNSLKSYINSLQDINKIADISYNSDIPIKYQSEVYIALKSEF